MKKLLIAAIGATAFVSLAQAADLPYMKGPPAYAYAPAFTWTGFYLGANAGLGFGSFDGAQRYFGSSPLGQPLRLHRRLQLPAGQPGGGRRGRFRLRPCRNSATPRTGFASTGVPAKLLLGARPRRLRHGPRPVLRNRRLCRRRGARRPLRIERGVRPDACRQRGWTLGSAWNARSPRSSRQGRVSLRLHWQQQLFQFALCGPNSINLDLLRAGVNYHF